MVSITVEYLIDHSYTQFPFFAPADYDIVVSEQTKGLTADPDFFAGIARHLDASSTRGWCLRIWKA